MDMVQPDTWAEALAARAERPDLLPIAGGTDVMVDINFDRRRPAGLLDLTRVEEIATWSVDGDVVRIGAGVTYAQVESDLATLLPGLAMASRTVGSPQIRNRGTVAGNLGSASPAGDAHPPLLAAGGRVEVESRARRQAGADGRLLRRREALRSRARRADPRRARAGRRRAPAVRQDRHPQRDGDRGGILRARAAPGSRAGSAPASARRPRPRARRRRRGAARRRARLGQPRAGRYRPSYAVSASWSPRPPTRSTTSAAPRPTAGTPLACSPPAPPPGPGTTTEPGRRHEGSTLHGERRGARRRRGVGRARACSTCCASGSACPGPRTPASRGSAAPAPSTSTG